MRKDLITGTSRTAHHSVPGTPQLTPRRSRRFDARVRMIVWRPPRYTPLPQHDAVHRKPIGSIEPPADKRLPTPEMPQRVAPPQCSHPFPPVLCALLKVPSESQLVKALRRFRLEDPRGGRRPQRPFYLAPHRLPPARATPGRAREMSVEMLHW
jgi:hypothetical protein